MYNFIKFIPAPDVAPIPSPPELFIFFIVFTFFVHILFMNLTLGGSILFVISKYFSKKEETKAIAKEIGSVNTFNISLTITTGVAPLLFYQVVYGQFFYSSSVLLGWKWLFVLVSIIVAYYFYYLYKMKPGYLKDGNDAGGGFVFVSAILFLYVALMLTTNTVLSMSPEKWLDIYMKKTSAFAITTVIPRVLHFIFAAIAFTGVFLMAYPKFRKSLSEEVKKEMYHFGKKSFVYATMIQIPVGILFLLTLKSESMGLVLGGSTIGLICWIVGILAAFYGVSRVFSRKETVVGLSVLLLISVACMVIVRRVVEYGYWNKYFDYSSLKVAPQWDVFGIFAILFVALLIVIFYTLKRNAKEFSANK
jgi:hypothetical protein